MTKINNSTMDSTLTRDELEGTLRERGRGKNKL